MVLRVIKVLLGILIIKSSISEYINYLSQTNSGNLVILFIVVLISIVGLLLIYSGVKNKSFLAVLKRKK